MLIKSLIEMKVSEECADEVFMYQKNVFTYLRVCPLVITLECPTHLGTLTLPGTSFGTLSGTSSDTFFGIWHCI